MTRDLSDPSLTRDDHADVASIVRKILRREFAIRFSSGTVVAITPGPGFGGAGGVAHVADSKGNVRPFKYGSGAPRVSTVVTGMTLPHGERLVLDAFTGLTQLEQALIAVDEKYEDYLVTGVPNGTLLDASVKYQTVARMTITNGTFPIQVKEDPTGPGGHVLEMVATGASSVSSLLMPDLLPITESVRYAPIVIGSRTNANVQLSFGFEYFRADGTSLGSNGATIVLSSNRHRVPLSPAYVVPVGARSVRITIGWYATGAGTLRLWLVGYKQLPSGVVNDYSTGSPEDIILGYNVRNDAVLGGGWRAILNGTKGAIAHIGGASKAFRLDADDTNTNADVEFPKLLAGTATRLMVEYDGRVTIGANAPATGKLLYVVGDIEATGTITAPSVSPIGSVIDYAGRGDPNANWLLCDGRAVSRSTYANLFGALIPTINTVTATIATPAVLTTPAAHGLNVNDVIYLTTTGALPSGLSANNLYYVSAVPSATTFRVSTTLGGGDVNTTGTQSGVHTLWFCPYGLGNGSTTFNIPDFRGRFALGQDNMGTAAAAANRLPAHYRTMGRSESGVATVSLQLGEMPTHTHTGPSHAHDMTHNHNAGQYQSEEWYRADGFTHWQYLYTGFYTSTHTGNTGAGGTGATGSAGTGTAHNNMPNYLVANKIIRVL